jgi:hypothetical protein
VTPFDLRPGVRVCLARLPDMSELLIAGVRLRALPELQGQRGKTGTVREVTSNKVAWVTWDDGTDGVWTAEYLERIG